MGGGTRSVASADPVGWVQQSETHQSLALEKQSYNISKQFIDRRCCVPSPLQVALDSRFMAVT
jgi:hypothetical protein